MPNQYDEMVKAIQEGGSTYYKGRIINRTSDLPTKAELVKGTPAEAETAADLTAQIAKLEAQRALLTGGPQPMAPHPAGQPLTPQPGGGQAPPEDDDDKFEDELIAELGAGPARAILEAEDPDAWADIYALSDEALLAISGVGQGSVDKIREREASA